MRPVSQLYGPRVAGTHTMLLVYVPCCWYAYRVAGTRTVLLVYVPRCWYAQGQSLVTMSHLSVRLRYG